MIVIFGASSDIGRRATQYLLGRNHKVRVVARKPFDVDPRAERVAGAISDAAELTRGADVVICCTHPRLVPQLLQNADPSVRNLVLVGSAWRNSRVKNPLADEVRSAEAAFLVSGRCGAMLHPTMIYGGAQEENIKQLLTVIRQWPVLPLPGGGRHLVQPIYVDDVANCITVAAEHTWDRPTVIPIAGPRSMSYRELVLACSRELGCRRVLLPVPLEPTIAFLAFIERLGIRPPIDPDVLRRFREDVNVSIAAMRNGLGVTPRSFEIGLHQAWIEWANKKEALPD